MQFNLNPEECVKLQKVLFEKNRYKTIVKQISENSSITTFENKVHFLNSILNIQKEERMVIDEIINNYCPNFNGIYSFNLIKKTLLLEE